MELAQACIAKSGLMQEMSFQTVGMSTTRMTITTTTTSPIWSVFQRQPINLTMRESEASNCERPLPNGPRLTMGSESSARRPPRCSLTRLNGNARASIVGLLLSLDTLRNGFVPKCAKSLFRMLSARFAGSRSGAKPIVRDRSGPAHIVAVGSCDERTLVYNLTVEDAHLFYANGVLSSNTEGEDHAGDSVRYAAMSRPYTAPLPAEMEPVVDRYARKFRVVRGGMSSGWAA
jgi:hypothetical protein